MLRSEVLEGFSEEMIELIHALHKEGESFGEMGIGMEEKSFYDILKSLAHKYDLVYPEDKLIELAKEVKAVVDDKARGSAVKYDQLLGVVPVSAYAGKSVTNSA